MSELDKLAKIIADRKSGSFGIITAIVDDGAKLTKEDRKFIAAMGTCADELMAVVMAADHMRRAHADCYCDANSGCMSCSPCLGRQNACDEAIAVLKDKLAGMK